MLPKDLENYPSPLHENVIEQNKIPINHRVESKNSKRSYIFYVIKTEILRFCENTTIRGLPRIVKERNKDLRTLWTFLVALLFFGCLMCMIFLAREFMAYNVIHPPRVLRDTVSPFPGVTVCNLRAISNSGKSVINKNNWRTPRDFGKNIFFYAQKDISNENQLMVRSLVHLPTYLSSIKDPNLMKSLGANKKELIINCQVTYLSGESHMTQDCDDIGHWQTITHPTYLNCMTFVLNPAHRNTTISMETQFYLGETKVSSQCIDCFTNDLKTQLVGAALVVHPADTFPNINHQAINLDPGSLTELNLIIQENINKEPPYGRCSRNVPGKIVLHNITFEYSEEACKQREIQNAIMKMCECIAIEYPHNENTNYPYCSDLSLFLSKDSCDSFKSDNSTEVTKCLAQIQLAIDRSICKGNVTKDLSKDVVDTCNAPCNYYSYESTFTTSKWPPKIWQLTWFRSIKKQYTLFQSEDFVKYEEALAYLDENKTDEAAEMISRLDIFERNVIGLIIRRPNFNLKRIEEKEVLSLTSLLSQTGGLFSIWIGLTMISLGEILECIYRCFSMFRDKNRSERFQEAAIVTEQTERVKTTDIDNSNIDNEYGILKTDPFRQENSIVKENPYALQFQEPKDSLKPEFVQNM